MNKLLRLSLLSLMFASPCFAQLTWDPVTDNGVVDGGSGIWSTGVNSWTNDSGTTNLPWTNGLNANFTLGSGTVSLGSTPIVVNNMNHTAAGYIINTAGNTFQLTGAGQGNNTAINFTGSNSILQLRNDANITFGGVGTGFNVTSLTNNGTINLARISGGPNQRLGVGNVTIGNSRTLTISNNAGSAGYNLQVQDLTVTGHAGNSISFTGSLDNNQNRLGILVTGTYTEIGATPNYRYTSYTGLASTNLAQTANQLEAGLQFATNANVSANITSPGTQNSHVTVFGVAAPGATVNYSGRLSTSSSATQASTLTLVARNGTLLNPSRLVITNSAILDADFSNAGPGTIDTRRFSLLGTGSDANIIEFQNGFNLINVAGAPSGPEAVSARIPRIGNVTWITNSSSNLPNVQGGGIIMQTQTGGIWSVRTNDQNFSQALTIDQTLTNNQNATVNTQTNLTLSRPSAQGPTLTILGNANAVTLNKTGAGNLIVTGSSNFGNNSVLNVNEGRMDLQGQMTSGTNTSWHVDGGTLLVNNLVNSNSPTVNVLNSGILSGSGGGQVSGAGGLGNVLINNGTIAPGVLENGFIGTLNVDGLDLSAGGVYQWELNALSTSNPGTDFDQIALHFNAMNDIILDGTSEIALNFLNSTDPSNGDAFWDNAQSWEVISFNGIGTSLDTFATISNGSFANGIFSTRNDGGNIFLDWNPTPIPEPSSWLLLGIGLGGAGIYRRYRKNKSSSM